MTDTSERKLVELKQELQTKISEMKWDCIIGISKAILELDPNNSKIHFHLGSAYYFQWKHEDAVSHFDKALEINNAYKEAHVIRGCALINWGKSKEAVNDFISAINIDDNYAMAYYCRGIAYFNLRMPDNALADMKKAYELDNAFKFGIINAIQINFPDYYLPE